MIGSICPGHEAGFSRRISSARNRSAAVNADGIVLERIAAASSPSTDRLGRIGTAANCGTFGAETAARVSDWNRTLGRCTTSSRVGLSSGEDTSSPLLRNRADWELSPLGAMLICPPEPCSDAEMGLSVIVGGRPETSSLDSNSCGFSDTSGRLDVAVRAGERDCSALRPVSALNQLGRGLGDRELRRVVLRAIS